MSQPPMPLRPLATVGNVNVDLIMGPVTPWPQPGTETLCPHDELRVGGSAGNSGLAWAGLGVPFQIAASTGADLYGDWLREGFGPRAGGWSRSPGATTLSVGIGHPNGERSFFTTSGHLPLFTAAEAIAMLDWPALKGGILLACGLFLMDGLTADFDALAARCARSGVMLAIDTGWPPGGWTLAALTACRSWIAAAQILLFNEVEAASLTGESDPDKAALALAATVAPDAFTVVKCGPQGAFLVHNGALLHAPAPKVAVVDTIGAGDVFNAALLAGLARGDTTGAALAFATATASRAVSTLPRRYDLPRIAESAL